ncbi:hemagglutinin [Aliivibrio sp. 1S165]|uniref:DUF11 domain-containing protein n=1 Tax=unclassified Aliivibrio TaxID=2645654 RepID=UPI00080E9A96|nr:MULTISPECIES: DUF11 domain-containing protein [unclassified Aliivibrio]OCH14845.1 hemagglutinin [Aliivibrio sp. 1S165]OCH34755.1 hemagglutinin [Aliivibrio sp. 1S175]
MTRFSYLNSYRFNTFLIMIFSSFITLNTLAADLSVTVTTDSAVYENNTSVTYDVIVTNTSSSTIDDISIIADFMSVTSGTENAFQSTSISGTATFLSNQGNYASSGDLNATGASLRSGGTLTYTIDALTAQTITENISLMATVEFKPSLISPTETIDSTPVVVVPVPYDYDLDLSVNKANYIINQSLDYTLKVSNTGDYKVQNLSIDQLFDSLPDGVSIDGSSSSNFSSVVISATTNGVESNAGVFTTSGDLSVTDAIIDVGGSIIYTIKTVVSDSLISDIVTSANAMTKDGNVDSNELITPPAIGELDITLHEFESTNSYLVNDEMQINLTVKNTGTGIASDYEVQHNINDLISDLGNNLDQNQYDSSDVISNPYITWTSKVTSIGSKSISALNTSGEVIDQIFDDIVSVYPEEEISYVITAKVTPATIGEIENVTASVFKADGSLADPINTISGVVDPEYVLNLSDPEITVSKTTTQSEYVPGGEVVYDITVNNTSDKYFANNLTIVDKLSCIQSEQAGGEGQGSAFSSWKLDVVNGSDIEGTDAGSFNYGATQTGDLTISPDIAPGEQVNYKLTTTVSDSSIGLILDNGLLCSDDVSESGTGVQMPDDSLSVTKDVDTHYYSSGQLLTYTIKVTNNGDGFADQIPVVDDLASVMVMDIYGNSVPAYSSWLITASAEKIDGTVASSTDTGITGAITSPTILDVKATIEPETIVTYKIIARTIPTANSEINNLVTVDESIIADRASVPKDFAVSIEKRVKVDNAISFSSEQTYYSKPEETVTYQLVVGNDKSNGYATNVNVTDEISAIEADMLEPDNTPMPVFMNWTITHEVNVIDASDLSAQEQEDLLAATDVGVTEDNKDLDTVAQIPPNVEVIYTIVANIDRSDENKIVWGSFNNIATVTTPDNGESDSDNAWVRYKDPDVFVTKTTSNDNFVIGEEVVFDIYVFNKGEGFANDVDVFDDINGLGVFEAGWVIESSTDSHSSSGSYADDKSTWPDGGNIQSKVDIDPKESAGGYDGMGYVAYKVTGIVKDDYSLSEISNTVETFDPATNTESSSTAELGEDALLSRFNVSIVKTSDKVKVIPGEDITYSITLYNNSSTTTANNLTVIDLMADIEGVLANDKDGYFEDDNDQSPFEYWSIKLDGETEFGDQNNDNFVYPEVGSSTTLNLNPLEAKVFQIKARVKDNFVGSNNTSGVLTNLLSNDAYVYRDYGEVTEESHVSHHDNERVGQGSATERELYVNGNVEQYYTPGDTLTYTIKVSSTTGYLNDHEIFEDIKGLSVQLMDGTYGNPFSELFSVKVEKEDSDGALGTTDGTMDGIVQDNENIDTTIDVAGGDYVLYTVEGIVRDDAIGNIEIGDATLRPNEYHLTFSKETDEVNYEPGETLTYHLVITNDGNGNAYDIPVLDEISKVEVELIDGTTGPAFEPGWTITTEVIGGAAGSNAQIGTVEDGEDIDTNASIPMDATIEYIVTATVSPYAVGEINNILSVNGDQVSALSKPNTQKFEYEKTILAYYDTDGTTVLPSGLDGYKPNGFIEYQIEIRNNNNVHLNDISIVDEISEIETECYDLTSGTTVSCTAFDAWSISAESDASSLSNPGTVENNKDIDTEFDLASTSSTLLQPFVRYTIKAHIRKEAVGSFFNKADIDNEYKVTSDRSVMLPVNLTTTHLGYTDTSLSTRKTTYNHTVDGEQAVYHLRLENTGNGLEYGNALVEKFSDLQVKLAQTLTSQPDSQYGAVYEPAGWKVTATTSDEPMTSIGDFVGGDNVDIDLPFVSIAPGGWIDFVMESQIREETLDDFRVVPTYGSSDLAAVRFNVDPSNLEVSKEIISIDGNPYSDGDTYKPGDVVEYQFTVNNNQPVWNDNTVIQDLISNITVEVIGGDIEPAFINTNISHVITRGLDLNVDTKTLNYDPSSDLDIQEADGLDIGPMETITFTITGEIRTDAVGIIDGNTAIGGTDSVTTSTIPPTDPILVFEKVVTNTTADGNSCSFPSNTGTGCEYNPNGQVTYQITVTNEGEGIANDVLIQDLISTINTSDGVTAFSSNSVNLIENPRPARFSISGNYNGTGDLNATFDLMPTDTVVFEISALVAGPATGSITNTATINSDTTNAIILNAGTAKILATKQSDISTYTPGQVINYTIGILNNSDTNSEVAIIDDISSFLVETADGSMQPALDSWSIDSRIVSDGDHDSAPSYTDISTLSTSGDINSTIKMAGENADSTRTLVEIIVTGVIREDAIGEFTNVVEIDGNNYRVNVGYVVPEKGELAVTKTTTNIPATYIPGESIGFDVAVENIGSGYLTDVNITDLVNNIKTDFAAQALSGQAFEQWDITDVVVTGTDPSLTQPVAGTEITGSNGYAIDYNIAPMQTVNLHLEGKVNDKAMGDITNEVVVTDSDGNIKTAQATYTPEEAALVVTKVVDKPIYEAGDTLTYTIEITNTTAAWAKDVKVTDFLSTIESTTIDGSVVTAFVPNSIDIIGTSSTGNSVIPVISNNDINGTIEIAPNDTVTIIASGQLLDNLHGEVKNIVTVELDSVIHTAEAISVPIIPTVTLTKEAPVEFYTPGEVSDYVLTVTNETNGFADDIKLQDIISGLTVETIDGATESAFNFWILDVEVLDSDTVITRSRSTFNEDIDVNIDLAPLDTVTFTISGNVNKNAIGVIKNTATMEFDGVSIDKEAELKPEDQKVTFNKTLKDGSKEGSYIAGEESEFYITLVNDAASFAQNIQITDLITDLQVDTVFGTTEQAFSSWSIDYHIYDDKYDTTTINSLPIGDDIDVVVDLAPSATIEFVVKGVVNPKALGEISNTATMNDGISSIDSTAVLQPESVVLVVKKIADKSEYTNDDDEITYTLAVTNRGSSDVSGVQLVDEISTLQGANGNPLFTEWTTTIKEVPGLSVVTTENSIDLNSTQTLKAYEGNGFIITVVGKIGKGLDDNITNTFIATAPGGETAQDSVTVHVKKFADNEGQLEVTKQALKDSIQVGDVVEYEVVIENNNEAEFKSVKLEDRYPSGFQYVENSTEVTNSGPDGVFDTADDVFSNQEPAVTQVLSFSIGDMLAYGSSGSTVQENVRVRYLLRATVGTTFGQYVNTAYAMTPAEGMTTGPLEIKSNMSSATVEITPDKLFDTASIIGKVFEDNNGDGYQADATAFDIKLTANIDHSHYVTGSTTIEIEGEKESLKEKGIVPINQSIVIDHLFGLSRNRTLPEGNIAVVQFATKNKDKFDFTVTTTDGSHISFSKSGVISIDHTGNKKDGLSAENLKITRNLYKDNNQYLWEIVIENMGIYEDGIPGVRLITVEGIVIETDEYGRYHVPDQWVLNNKGKQFLVKVDTDSLPTGMKVISENPKVLRISPNQLTKFNFSIQK